ncbi:MAG: sulfatase [Acidobacteria bacterium]|nr:sulfatase [Acidobacteriota bacterium]
MFLQKQAVSFQKRSSHQLRRKLGLIGCFLCLALGLAGLPKPVWSQFFPQPAHLQRVRPNIILILTDDQDTQSFGFMPRLKHHLIDQGTRFNNFFSSNPECCPSRTSILRGQYTHNHQVLANEAPIGGFQRFQQLGLENSTIAKWLQDSGYRTALLGKYLNGYPKGFPANYVPPGWTEWCVPTNGQPSNYFNYQLNVNGTVKTYGGEPESYLTDVLSTYAVNFIEQQANADTPFCLFLCGIAPHTPATPAPRHLNEFNSAKTPRVPSFNEADVNDKPAFVRRFPLLSEERIQSIDKLYQNRLRTLLAVDEMVERVVETLRRTGQLENTYIFFTTDNGFHLGTHRFPFGKGTPYEDAIRFPLIVRGPGVVAGRELPAMIATIDLAPTFAELAGITAPEFVDGNSLVSFLGPDIPPTDDQQQNVLVEHWPGKGEDDKPDNQFMYLESVNQGAVGNSRKKKPRAPQWAAIRTKRYMYIEYVTGERELYDLQVDPYELQNIYSTAQPPLLRSLEANLNALRTCVGPGCRKAQRVRL